MKIFPKKAIAALSPYKSPRWEGEIKLDANESPYDLPLEIKRRIFKELTTTRFNRYPDAEARDLREAYARRFGLPIEWITAGNGSDELIMYIILAFARNKIIFSSPTFAMYRVIGISCGAKVVDIPLDNNFELQPKKIVSEKGASIIFISRPNNPTGNSFKKEEVINIIKKTKALVVVDEAYAEFCQDTLLPYLKRFKNLVILRTFSKAFGLAGIRVGFMLGQPYLSELVNKVRLPYNLSLFSQVAGRIVLGNSRLLDDSLRTIMAERDRLFEDLKTIDGFSPCRSQANFILFRTSFPSSRLSSYLARKGILIRNLNGYPGLKNCLRVTIGTKKENNLFLRSVREESHEKRRSYQA